MAQVCTTHSIPQGQSITVNSSTAPVLEGGGATPGSTSVTDNGDGTFTIQNNGSGTVTQSWCVGDPHITTLGGMNYTL